MRGQDTPLVKNVVPLTRTIEFPELRGLIHQVLKENPSSTGPYDYLQTVFGNAGNHIHLSYVIMVSVYSGDIFHRTRARINVSSIEVKEAELILASATAATWKEVIVSPQEDRQVRWVYNQIYTHMVSLGLKDLFSNCKVIRVGDGTSKLE